MARQRNAPVTVQDFLSHTRQEGSCMLWTRALNSDGYPRAVINGNFNGKVHRHMYSLVHPDEELVGKVIRHTCDTPACINPDHLLSGSPADNMRDRDSRLRGRQAFTPEQILTIRADWETGQYTQTSLARKHNTTQGSIRLIVLGLSYKWVSVNPQED